MLKKIRSKFHKTLVLCIYIVRKIENSKIVVSNRMSLLYINATQVYAYHIYAYIYIYIKNLRNRKNFPCFYRIIETRVKVWEKREIAWEHEHEVRVFPRNFEFLPNFHKCFYKLYRNTEKMFSISFIK